MVSQFYIIYTCKQQYICTHICTNVYTHTYTAPLLGCFWKLTIERETGKRLRSSTEVLALVTGLKIAATANRSSNF